MSNQFWMIWPGNAVASALILIAIAMPFLYAARRLVHDLLHSLGRMAGGPLRLGARRLFATARDMKERNKAVLLAHGREEVGQHIEREFERISALVTRDLEGYPALQRKLLEEITRVEEDYKKCGEVPPPPPEWVEAVTAIAKVKSEGGNEMVQRILEEIKRSVHSIHDKALADYRRAYESRHKILNGFMPFWRSLDKTFGQVDKKLTGLHDTSSKIDAQMEKYEQINKKTDKAEHALTVSAFTQFAISLLVLLIAVGGALVNFKMIALPFSEIVGAGDYLTATLRMSDVAALVLIFLEATMGLFVMETLRITHLYPIIANMSERMRRRMFWTAVVFLFVFAGIEAALALMRDMLASDKQALVRSLASAQVGPPDPLLRLIPTTAQMLLGFFLPFALAFVAVPLESFVYSLRTVGGAFVVMLIRATAFVLRVLGNFIRQLCRVLIGVYDITIVLPLLIERLVRATRSEGDASESRPVKRAA